MLFGVFALTQELAVPDPTVGPADSGKIVSDSAEEGRRAFWGGKEKAQGEIGPRNWQQVAWICTR